MSKKLNFFIYLINKSIYKYFISLSQFLFNTPSNNDLDSYLYEAKCQLLMYASIAFIKLNTIVCVFSLFIFFLLIEIFLETSIGK